MVEKIYRDEHKYISPEHILSSQELRASAVMVRDSHVGDAGFYSIRSIYFDDIYGTCFLENEDGTDPREKFRIRIYNNSRDRITLELKQKERGKCRKTSCALSLETTETIISGGIPDFSSETPFLLKKLIAQMRLRALHPVVIVAYERVPFVCPDGNVRVTFDRNLRSSNQINRFFDDDVPFRPVFPIGTNMMEVKFDGLLPDYINAALQCGQLQRTSFSKYYFCRKFGVLH